MEITGKIKAKAGNGKGFMVEGQEGWFNATPAVVPYLAKYEKGTEVEVTFEKKGVNKIVSKIVVAMNNIKEATTTTSEPVTTGFICEDCGAVLKDGKYKKCYTCNKKNPAKAKPVGASNSYDNPAKTAQIQRGNALNAASAVASSQQFTDPDTAKQFTLMLADEFLTWLRAE